VLEFQADRMPKRGSNAAGIAKKDACTVAELVVPLVMHVIVFKIGFLCVWGNFRSEADAC
jgi:hypothetical protein